MRAPEHAPGTQVPESGVYELRNVLGTPTGERIVLSHGDRFPPAPRGFTWSLSEARRDTRAHC